MFLFLILLFGTHSRAFNFDLPSELRLPASHELTDGQIPLGLEPVISRLAPSPSSAPSEVTFTYRCDLHRNGVMKMGSLPVKLKLDWRVPFINTGIHTASKSSPAVDDSGIYVGSDSSWFYAYDLRGHLKWRRMIPHAALGIHDTATLDQTRVYFGGYNGTLYAVNKADGKLVWDIKLGDAIGSSPAVDKDFIYISVEKSDPPNGFVAKIRRSDGGLVWQTQLLGEQPHSSPVVNETDGLIHMGANNGNFFGIDKETGKIKWQFKTGMPIKSTAALIDSKICFSDWSMKAYCLEASTGKKIWETRLYGRSRTSLTYIPDLDYFVTASENGFLYALRAKDGSMVWKLTTGNRNMISSSLLIKDEKNSAKSPWVIWDTCQKYSLCAISPQDGNILSRLEIPSPLTSVPVYFDGALYVSLDREGGLERFVP